MANKKNAVIEYRNYNLPTFFPVMVLSGEDWRISDVKSNHLHFHNHIELGYCETDSGTIEFADVSKEFKAGYATFIGTNVAHTTYSDKGTSSKWSYVFIDIEELLSPYFPLDLIVDSMTLGYITHNFYSVYAENDHPWITHLILGLIRELVEKPENYQFSVRGMALSLLVHLINDYKRNEYKFEDANLISKEKRLVIAPALDFIHNNYMHEFPIEDLAEKCDMSPTHFRRMFQSIMGTSPLDYLNNTRIAKASALLRSTDLPVLTISEEVGFRSVSSFNRHFLEVTGTTPLKLRKAMSFTENKSVLKYTGWMKPEP